MLINVKKMFVIGVFVVSVCMSFWAGNYFRCREESERRKQQCNTMIAFSVNKLENLKKQYDADTMEALISNIYAAYEYSPSGELSSALHELWNTLIFNGENIAGKEDDLIIALKDISVHGIKDIAVSMRRPH